AVTEDDDALGINVRTLGKKVESRGAWYFVIVAARHVADPSRLAHAGAVQCEGVDAATCELPAREKDAHLLGIVHAVQDDDRRRRTAIRGRLHEQRRQRGSLVGHLDEFDRRFAQADAGVPAMIGFFGLRSLFRARRDEALGVVVIDAGAQIVVAGGDLVALGHRRVGAALELRAHRAPLFLPGLRIALAPAQPLADAVDLL